MPLLQVENLVKTYPGVRAVDDIFTVGEGSCFGLLGPNGASKTTTLEILEGITGADSGRVLYRGAPRRQLSCGGRHPVPAYRAAGLPDRAHGPAAVCEFLSTAAPDVRNLSSCATSASCWIATPAPCPAGNASGFAAGGRAGQRPGPGVPRRTTTGLDPQSRRNFWRLIEV